MISSFAKLLLAPQRRRFILLLVLSIISTIALAAQAWFFANFINDLFIGRRPIEQEIQPLVYLLLAIGVRALFHYWQEETAVHMAGVIKQDLRDKVLAHCLALGPYSPVPKGDVVHLLTDGLEQIEGYMARYVPQMLMAVLIPGIMALVMIDTVTWVAIILGITFPIIPFFMILIGKKAESMNKAQWERMSLLGGHFLDVLQGITTLKVFGRSREQGSVIARMSGEFRDATLRVLRVAFLSAFVLELISTISTALIAVAMGLDLLVGHVSFLAAFFVLLLAPEFYAPLRQLGSAFHTGMAGKVALQEAESYLAIPVREPASGNQTIEDPIESIEFKQVSYTYGEKEEKAALKDVSFTLKRGKVVVLVGQSGAGKTTTAQLLLRFLQASRGRITVNGQNLLDLESGWWREQITFVPQEAHVVHGTVRDNISFGRQVSDEAVRAAAVAANADAFIQTLPQGYDTVIGDGSQGLSGGQVQRIALARAFISNRPILVLDEMTAHLDRQTEQAIHKALRRLMENKIVLCIGHRRETMELADTLLVMKEGRLIEEGTFSQLEEQKGYFYSLLHPTVERPEKTINEVQSLPVIPAIGEKEDVHNLGNTSVSPLQGLAGRQSQVRQSAWGRLCLLFSVLRSARLSLFGSTLFSFLTVFTNVGLLATSAWLLARAALHPELFVLSLAIVGVRFYGISRAVCRYIERYVSHHMAFQGLYGLRCWLYERIEPLAPAVLHKWGAGDMLGRIMADIETLQFFYLRVILPPVGAILLTVIGWFFLDIYNGLAPWVLIVAAFLGGVIIPAFVYRYTKRSVIGELEVRSQGKNQVVSLLDTMIEVVFYGRQDEYRQRVGQGFAELGSLQAHVQKGINLGNTFFMMLIQLASISVAAVTAWYTDSILSGVAIATVAVAMQAYFECLAPLVITVHHGKESDEAMKRLVTLATTKPTVLEKEAYSYTVAAPDSLEERRIEPVAICIENLSFSYEKEGRQILAIPQLTIPKGQKVAIVGASGSGKTTLFSVLERFYDYQGQIKMNGVDLKSIEAEEARHLYTMQTQHSYLFHASIEDNIRLAKPRASKEEIKNALDFARLTAWIQTLPKGLATIVGTGGMGVSGGQRQRIALARLYLRQAPILLLDEPLEGLDGLTQAAVYEALLERMTGKTVLYVTHQLEGLEKMDRILFMEDGQIVEDGSYEELMNKKGLFYSYRRISGLVS